MVCTTAFGIGVDVSNVDLVIRIGCPPPSLEELVQEFGRAGRDGRSARGSVLEKKRMIYSCSTSVTVDVPFF